MNKYNKNAGGSHPDKSSVIEFIKTIILYMTVTKRLKRRIPYFMMNLLQYIKWCASNNLDGVHIFINGNSIVKFLKQLKRKNPTVTYLTIKN